MKTSTMNILKSSGSFGLNVLSLGYRSTPTELIPNFVRTAGIEPATSRI